MSALFDVGYLDVLKCMSFNLTIAWNLALGVKHHTEFQVQSIRHILTIVCLLWVVVENNEWASS